MTVWCLFLDWMLIRHVQISIWLSWNNLPNLGNGNYGHGNNNHGHGNYGNGGHYGNGNHGNF